jgi:excinuclease ABC subunit C
MRDNTGAIIYIGKARNLKKRVASYFLASKVRDSRGTALVGTIQHVDYVPTASERDALVLERRLINRYKPTFNVMWKDDKSYPFVTLTLQEDFPRIFLTRKKKKDGSLYFGPYPNVSRLRQLLRWTWRKKFFSTAPLRSQN